MSLNQHPRESRDYLEMSFRSIRLFAREGGINAAGLQELIDLALRDGILDGNEIRVLREVVQRIKPQELTPELKAKLGELSELLRKFGQ